MNRVSALRDPIALMSSRYVAGIRVIRPKTGPGGASDLQRILRDGREPSPLRLLRDVGENTALCGLFPDNFCAESAPWARKSAGSFREWAISESGRVGLLGSSYISDFHSGGET